MKNLQMGRIFLILSLCFTLTGFSQSLYNGVGHIPAASKVNWTNAGLYNPILAADHILNIVDYTTGDYNDRIEAAMDSAEANFAEGDITIIYFPAGTYTFPRTIVLRSNFIIQGEGSGSTFFEFANGKCDDGFLIQGVGELNGRPVSMDIAKTDSIIHVSDTSGYDVDDWIQFKELANPEAYVRPGYGPGKRGYATPGQVSKITNKTTGSITIKDEASKAYDKDHDLFLYKIEPVKNVGIENLSIERLPDGDGWGKGRTILFKHAVNCWVRGVDSYMTFRGHVDINASSHIEISGCYLHNAYSSCSEVSCGGGQDGFGYGITVVGTSTNCLIENNILRKNRHALLAAGGANCNVFTYNYSRENTLQWDAPIIGCIDRPGGDMILHSQYSYANLFEQNRGINILADDVHGKNGPYNAFVRNITTDDHANLKVMQQWSSLGNLEETGNDFDPLRHNYDNAPTLDVFGFLSNYTLGPTHNSAYGYFEYSDYRLDDVSYHYSSRPYFLDEGHNYYCTWPSLGPGTTSSGDPWQMIPAKYRWDYRNYGDKLTYIEPPTSHPPLPPTQNPTLSGQLTADEVWGGSIALQGDVTIPGGITLNINRGTVITFPDYVEMYVEGTLIAQGTAADQVIFTSQAQTYGNSENTYLVRFNNASSSGSIVDYCKFQYAYRGIYIDDADPIISHSEITNCYYGIYNNYAKPFFYHNTITACSYGVYNYWSDGQIMSNEFNTGSYGIYNYRSSPDIGRNKINGGAFGIWCNSYSSPKLGSYAYAVPGDNEVYNTDLVGLYAENNSNPFLGSAFCQLPGYNSFYNNLTSQVTATPNSSVLAEDNWWGTANPFSYWFSGDVDYTPYLTNPPTSKMQKSPEEEVFDTAFKRNSSDVQKSGNEIRTEAIAQLDPGWTLRQKTRFIHALIYNGDPKGALKLCKDVIKDYPDSSKTFFLRST